MKQISLQTPNPPTTPDKVPIRAAAHPSDPIHNEKQRHRLTVTVLTPEYMRLNWMSAHIVGRCFQSRMYQPLRRPPLGALFSGSVRTLTSCTLTLVRLYSSTTPLGFGSYTALLILLCVGHLQYGIYLFLISKMSETECKLKIAQKICYVRNPKDSGRSPKSRSKVTSKFKVQSCRELLQVHHSQSGRSPRGEVGEEGKSRNPRKLPEGSSRVLGRGKQIEIGKSNFSSKVHSTGIRNYILQSRELRTVGKRE